MTSLHTLQVGSHKLMDGKVCLFYVALFRDVCRVVSAIGMRRLRGLYIVFLSTTQCEGVWGEVHHVLESGMWQFYRWSDVLDIVYGVAYEALTVVV